jgi:uncharacterized membrane protein
VRLRRPRLTFGLLVGIAAYALLLGFTAIHWRLRLIAAWDIGASAALLALFAGLRNSRAEDMKRNALLQDTGKWVVSILSLIAATASLVVIAAEMPRVKEVHDLVRFEHVFFVIYTIVVSWAFMHTVFALHYAHDYYMDEQQRLVFPGGRRPTYGDFLYFSFTIGMTFQVSDVQVADSKFRRLVILHGATSFFYSSVILALMINLVAGLLGP